MYAWDPWTRLNGPEYGMVKWWILKLFHEW